MKSGVDLFGNLDVAHFFTLVRAWIKRAIPDWNYETLKQNILYATMYQEELVKQGQTLAIYKEKQVPKLK